MSSWVWPTIMWWWATLLKYPACVRRQHHFPTQELRSSLGVLSPCIHSLNVLNDCKLVLIRCVSWSDHTPKTHGPNFPSNSRGSSWFSDRSFLQAWSIDFITLAREGTWHWKGHLVALEGKHREILATNVHKETWVFNNFTEIHIRLSSLIHQPFLHQKGKNTHQRHGRCNRSRWDKYLGFLKIKHSKIGTLSHLENWGTQKNIT